jgi:hypothetical protein
VTDLLPIVEGLRDCLSNAERAAWLFQCPPGIFVTHHMEIRKILTDAGFAAGVAYLEAKVAGQMATCLKDGSTRPNILFSIHLARIDLAIAARTGGAT